MTLSISILGSLIIESDECRLGKVPKKARALLAYLTSQAGQSVSRERLADLLWPYQGCRARSQRLAQFQETIAKTATRLFRTLRCRQELCRRLGDEVDQAAW
jgi:two-component SAPR family response regulator